MSRRIPLIRTSARNSTHSGPLSHPGPHSHSGPRSHPGPRSLRGRALTIAVVLTILLTAQAQPVLQAQETEGASPLQQTLERLDLPQRIEESFLKIPRSFFLPDQLHSFANEDQPIPLYSGAIVPDFSSVAVLVGEMAIRSDSRILVVGRGCGFFAAIAATLAARVEVVEALDAQAEIYPERWEELGLENVVLASQEEAFEREYDGIMVHAATDSIPPRIISVLGEGGRLVAPLTDGSGNQVLTVFFRDGEKLSVSTAGEVFFPPGQKVF